MSLRASAFLSLLVAGQACSAASAPAPDPDRPAAQTIKALRATDVLPQDPDDPAVWINRADPAKSIVFGTMKVAAPNGALAIFGTDGKLRQLLKGPDRPNNVDVEYGLDLDATPTDIAVLTERLGRRLRVYSISNDGTTVRDISSGTMPILAGAPGDQGAPMGIGLYKRPKDGAIFAIVSPKAGPKDNYLWQYRLEDDGTGRVKATFVRRFGHFSGVGEIEAVAVDDELGYVYYADEVPVFTSGWRIPTRRSGSASSRCSARRATQDREGLGIYTLPNGQGLSSSRSISCRRERLSRLPARRANPDGRTITRRRCSHSPAERTAPTAWT
jgi:3-phytase